jgi:predicted nucleic acid-binding protein
VGLTVLDASVIIAVLDRSDRHHAAARERLHARVAARDGLIVPASACAEILVGPSRRGPDAVETVDAFLAALPARIEPATAAVARRAAALRATHGNRLRLPDAFVIGTAIELEAGRILTAYRRWPPLSIVVEVL